MRNIVQTLAVSASLALAGAASVGAAQAFPLYGAPAVAASPIIEARWPCGPGWHPNPWGRCVPNGGYYYGGPGWGYRHAWGGPGWGGPGWRGPGWGGPGWGGPGWHGHPHGGWGHGGWGHGPYRG